MRGERGRGERGGRGGRIRKGFDECVFLAVALVAHKFQGVHGVLIFVLTYVKE